MYILKIRNEGNLKDKKAQSPFIEVFHVLSHKNENERAVELLREEIVRSLL